MKIYTVTYITLNAGYLTAIKIAIFIYYINISVRRHYDLKAITRMGKSNSPFVIVDHPYGLAIEGAVYA